MHVDEMIACADCGKQLSATCGNCGGVAELPFRPRGDKPVFCRDCFGSKPTFR